MPASTTCNYCRVPKCNNSSKHMYLRMINFPLICLWKRMALCYSPGWRRESRYIWSWHFKQSNYWTSTGSKTWCYSLMTWKDRSNIWYLGKCSLTYSKQCVWPVPTDPTMQLFLFQLTDLYIHIIYIF